MARDEDRTAEGEPQSVRVPRRCIEELHGLEEGIVRTILVLCYQEDVAPGGEVARTTRQIATVAGISLARARKALEELVSIGWAMRTRDGKWLLARPLPLGPPEQGKRGGEAKSPTPAASLTAPCP